MLLTAFIFIVFVVTTGGFAFLKANTNEGSSDMITLLSVRRWVYVVEITAVLVLSLVSSVFMTTDRQTGFVETFGQVQMINRAGPHLKLPFIAKKYIYDATVRSRAIGYDEATGKSTGEVVCLTADENIIAPDFNYQYHIANPVDFCYGTDEPEKILRNAIISAIRGNIGLDTVDSVMTTGKGALEVAIYEDVVSVLEEHRTGLVLDSITMQDSEPPEENVNAAFKAVEEARQAAEAKRNEANGYNNAELQAAGGKASEVINMASAYQVQRINQAAEEVAQFDALYAQYQRNPQVVKKVLYYQTMQEILPKMKVIIGEDSSVVLVNGTGLTLSANADE